MIKNFWNRLFLEERPSISLGLFRIAAALTTAFHVIPSLLHLPDNYFSTAFKTYNPSFFTIEVLQLVQKSPDWLVVVFVWIFCVSCFSFLIGFLSQLSCIVMTLACYYFYALNALHVGTLSWDILLVTLFLMCITGYHGDYFSVDCVRKRDEQSYKKQRPFFVQRLLQLQIGFTFFYTALYKVTAQGNWLTHNPIYSLMNYPTTGVVKTFILKDFLYDQPQLCFAIGVLIVTLELLMIFLLFYHRTRIAAIYLGCFFHVLLILTLDVPATFFFLFPPQLLLFVNPRRLIKWIEGKRNYHAASRQCQLLYDGKCQFCLNSVKQLKVMDLFGELKYVDFQSHLDQLEKLHPDLTKQAALSQLHLIDTDGSLTGGFDALKRLSLKLPMLWPFIFPFYFPGASFVGKIMYRWVANHRYLFHRGPVCTDHSCFK